MASLALAEPATDRPLRLRSRADLQSAAQWFSGLRYWAIKDPVALRYFHLRDEEFFVLLLLDGSRSLEAIRRECNARFAPRVFDHAELQGLLASLHRHGLVVSESSGQGQQMLARWHDHARKRRYEQFIGLLALRFRGVNPRRFLDWFAPKVGFLFSPAAVTCVMALAIAALVLVAVHFDAFLARLPNVHTIVGASNLPWLLVVLAVVKMLHELGHAVACRRFGGDCHEIGVMLLVFTPSLYCNVSDSWMIASKWRRMAIAAAGMYIELLLAAVCTLAWLFSQPGLVNSLALNTILISSIGTLMFNGNPLLRYDGYFILADLVEVPNLRSEATAALHRIASRYCLGIELPGGHSQTPKRQFLLLAYAIASTLYRWFVVAAVLWALHVVLRQYRLQVLVLPIAAVTLVGMAWPLAMAVARAAQRPGAWRRVAPARLALTVLVVIVLVATALLAPLPQRVMAPLMIEYRDALRVYVTVPGRLTADVHNGDQVERGQLLARLANSEVELQVARLRSERDQQRLYVKNLEAQRLQGLIDGAQIPTATAALADLDKRLQQLEREAAELAIKSPRAGTVLPAPIVAHESKSLESLPHWTGTPLDSQNASAWLDRGTTLCLVGDPTKFEAIVHVDEADVELVSEGQRVRLSIDGLPGETFWGTVVELARLDLKVMPRELAAAGDLPARSDQRGAARPLDTWYQARVQFEQDPPRLVARVHGEAKIVVASQSLATQLTRYLQQTFGR